MCSGHYGYYVFELSPPEFNENEKLIYRKCEDGKTHFYKLLDIKDGKRPLILPYLAKLVFC